MAPIHSSIPAAAPGSSSQAARQMSSPGPAILREHAIFNKDESKFLKSFLPEYYTICSAQDGTSKGDKKGWVLGTIFPAFLTRFNPKTSGDSLCTKMVCWFHNRPKKGLVVKHPSKNEKVNRPRATNALEVYATENKEVITRRMSEKHLEEGMSRPAKEVNLADYKKIRQETFDSLDDSAKAKYILKANAQNEKVKTGPTDNDIFNNQEQIVENTIIALRALVGRGWKGHGDAVFFVQGAYRDRNHDLRSFNTTVGDNADMNPYKSYVPDFADTIKKPFKNWACVDTLPRHVEAPAVIVTIPATTPEPLLTVSYCDDGFPVMPTIDLESISPKDLKRLMTEYITAVWTKALPHSKVNPLVPWDDLHNGDKGRLLDNLVPFIEFSSLDPSCTSILELYKIMGKIISEQEKGEAPMKFALDYEVLYTLSLDQNKASSIAIDSPAKARKKAPKKSKKTIVQSESETEQMDFSVPYPLGTALASGKSSLAPRSHEIQNSPQPPSPAPSSNIHSSAKSKHVAGNDTTLPPAAKKPGSPTLVVEQERTSQSTTTSSPTVKNPLATPLAVSAEPGDLIQLQNVLNLPPTSTRLNQEAHPKPVAKRKKTTEVHETDILPQGSRRNRQKTARARGDDL